MNRLVILLLVLMSVNSRAAEGGLVGNGGDVIECKAQPGNPFNGLYSLDYILTFQVSNQNADIVQVPNLRNSVERLRLLINQKLPELVESFESFTLYYRNTKAKNAPRFWEEAGFGLVDVKDEQMVAQVSENCKTGGQVKVVQAIIRQFPEFSGTPQDTIVYKFVPAVLDSLEQRSAVQVSFLYVHEWLWDFSQNVDRNRRLNRFFHSKAFETMSAAEVREAVLRMGLVMPKMMPPVFREESCMPNPPSVPRFLERQAKGTPTAGVGSFGVYTRHRLCYEGSVCGPASWFDTSSSEQHTFGDHVPKGVVIASKQPAVIKLMTRVELAGPRTLASCALEVSTGRLACSEFLQPDAVPYRPFNGVFPNTGTSSIQMTGGLTNECMRISAAGRSEPRYGRDRKRYWEEYQIVVYAKFASPGGGTK